MRIVYPRIPLPSVRLYNTWCTLTDSLQIDRSNGDICLKSDMHSF